MQIYHDMLRHILAHGKVRGDRTGTGTIGVFGYQNRYDLTQGFPLLTSKKIHTKSIMWELVWFLQGRTDNQWLKEHGVSIWDAWATKEQCAKFDRPEGDLGRIYGAQWRNFGATHLLDGTYDADGVDQIHWVIEEIQKNPNSRRLIVTGWNPAEQGLVALPPCHTMFQFYVQDGALSCQLYQRSADSFLGVPFNIASYSLLTHLVATVCNLKVDSFTHTFGDLHIYLNHREQVDALLARELRPLPTITINERLRGRGFDGILEFTPDDVTITGYDPHPVIQAPVAV